MSSDSYAVQVTGLSKRYQIYDSPRARLKQFVLPRFRRLFGIAPGQYFTDFDALNRVSFQIGKGETVGIIGRNGSGKSTLLQIICGTLTPSEGSVNTSGRIAALLELGSGFNPEFSGRENVYLNAAVLGLSKREVDERYEDIKAFADIGQFIEQPTKTYSSGMVVRLAFATAIHMEPDILVVDEALAVGDTAFQQKCLGRIRQMQKRGVTILLVTHSANTLIEYCDRGIFLKSGSLVLDGVCRDVVKAYADDLVEEEGGVTMVFSGADDSPKDARNRQTSPLVGSVILPPGDQPVDDVPLKITGFRLLDAEHQPRAAFNYGEKIDLEITLSVNREISKPCFGVQISSPDGMSLWSATTQAMDIQIEGLTPNTYLMTWRLQATFGGGRYVVALGAGQMINGDYKRHHRVDYAGHFEVLPLRASGSGWLAPQPQFISPIPLRRREHEHPAG